LDASECLPAEIDTKSWDELEKNIASRELVAKNAGKFKGIFSLEGELKGADEGWSVWSPRPRDAERQNGETEGAWECGQLQPRGFYDCRDFAGRRFFFPPFPRGHVAIS
jgi:hypothetical protein